jgi:hypothetical protein
MSAKTPLTKTELSIVEKLSHAHFPPATASKRLIRDLASGHVKNLSARGREFLAFVAHRFRRQWKPTAAELAWVRERLAAKAANESLTKGNGSRPRQRTERVPPEYLPGARLPRAEFPDAAEWIGGAVVNSRHGEPPNQLRHSRAAKAAGKAGLAHPPHRAPAQLSLF